MTEPNKVETEVAVPELPPKPLDALFNEWLKENNATFTIVSVSSKTKTQVPLDEWLPVGWGILIGFSSLEKK